MLKMIMDAWKYSLTCIDSQDQFLYLDAPTKVFQCYDFFIYYFYAHLLYGSPPRHPTSSTGLRSFIALVYFWFERCPSFIVSLPLLSDRFLCVRVLGLNLCSPMLQQGHGQCRSKTSYTPGLRV